MSRRKMKGRSRKGKAKMSNADKTFHKTLCRLKSMKDSDRCKALANADANFIRKLSTTVRKLRNRKVTEKQQQRLKPYTSQLRQLANPKFSITSKRRLLSQRGGGGLAKILLPLAASIVGPVVEKIFGK